MVHGAAFFSDFIHIRRIFRAHPSTSQSEVSSGVSLDAGGSFSGVIFGCHVVHEAHAMNLVQHAIDASPWVVTFFSDFAAQSKNEILVDLEDLVRRIRTTTGSAKALLPWLKMARFGDVRTSKGSLRHDANMLSISGIEADYDGGAIGVTEAVQRLEAADVLGVVYTSPSHSEDAPRWRVLCPLSQEYTPDERDRFLARLNGLFGGIFANESWTRSQSYYYGSVNNNPSHQVVPVIGTPLDLLEHLDAVALNKPEKPGTNGTVHHGPATPPAEITDSRINGLINRLLDNIRHAPDGQKYFTLRDISYTVGGYLHLTSWTEAEAVEACVAALPSAQDWAAARKTAAAAIAAGRAKPLDLENRPGYFGRARDPGVGPIPGIPPVGDNPENNQPPPPPPAGGKDDNTENTGGGGPGGNIPLPEDDGRGGDPSLITEQYAMREFVALHHEHLRFNHASGMWLLWDENFWKPDERKLAFNWALNLCRELALTIEGKKAREGRIVVEKRTFSGAVELGARTFPEVATTQSDWDADPMLLGTPGGIVDLATGILRPGERADMISRSTKVTPSLMPDCPTWLGFLDYALHEDGQGGTEKMARFVQRYFGYGLTGLTKEEQFVFLFGPGGAGKGTLVETIADLMGDYAGFVTMEVFTSQILAGKAEYYRADMAGKRLIVSTEPERGVFWQEALIKEITGGDTLSGRHPMGRPFRFKPSHKLVMEGNHMPRLKGRSTGMERRLNILPFERKPVTIDRELKTKLLAEGPGILRWLIEGCLAWQKIGLNPPDKVKLASSKYFEAQDVFRRWVDERCILDRYAEHTPTELNKSFNAWARDSNELEMNGNAFSEALDQFETEPPLQRGKTHSKRWVRGLRIMPSKTNDRWDDL